MIDDREDRIRARAHAIWEGEGRPHGRHDEHWRMASQEAGETSDPSARSLGSAAQSDLIPEDAGQGAERAGSLVDTGPAIGLAAGMAGTGGAVGGLGNLSLGQEVGHGADEGSGEPGGMSSIGSGSEAATGDQTGRTTTRKAPRTQA